MLEKEPEDSFLNYALALEYAKINKLELAISTLATILQKDKNYLGAYYQLGKLYEQNNQKEQAIHTYKSGIAIAQQQSNSKALAELKEALSVVVVE